jgi:hypothetical protein
LQAFQKKAHKSTFMLLLAGMLSNARFIKCKKYSFALSTFTPKKTWELHRPKKAETMYSSQCPFEGQRLLLFDSPD